MFGSAAEPQVPAVEFEIEQTENFFFVAGCLAILHFVNFLFLTFYCVQRPNTLTEFL